MGLSSYQDGVRLFKFDPEGKYRYNFFLPLLNSKTGDSYHQLYFPVVVQDGYLYAIEHDEERVFSIAEYEIID
jgi:hypothetical protein